MPTAFGLPQLLSLYDPNVAVEQAQLDRQTALANALRQESLTPIQTNGQIGGMGYRVSPLNIVAKALQGYQANQLYNQTDQQRLSMAAALAQAVRGPQGQSSEAPVTGADATSDVNAAPVSAPASPAAQPSSGIGLPQMIRGAMLEAFSPALAGAYAKGLTPTDISREVAAAGIDPNSTLGHQLIQQHLAKGNYIPPVSGRPGGYLATPNGQITNLPKVPDGYAAVQNPNSPTGFDIVPQPGGIGAVQGSTQASATGTGTGHALTTIAPTQFDSRGNPLPTTSVASALGLTSEGQIPPAVQASRDDQRRSILAAELRKTTDPQDRKAIETELNATRGGTATIPQRSFTAQPVGLPEAQKELHDSWTALQAQNREAMNTSSYLDNIVTAAHKGAIVGPGADRREMIQGMLQLAGINEKVNENAVSQTQLLDKYHNQIVTRLGQGGLGTDAARAMLDAAYPGQPMNVTAIDEAAANLKGAQAMVQAKTRFLTDAATKRDAPTFQQREVQFDQNADPRIWQWAAIQDPNARKAFLAQTLKQDPTFLDRVKKLKALGALD